jgi:glycosyltransferase involved in cell wall biosynthesis
MRRTERLSLDRSDHLLVLTEEMADVLRRFGVTRPVDVLPLWATVEVTPEDIEGHEQPTVQYSGNFGAKQGVTSLVDLARELEDLAPAVPLVLRGAGWRFEEMRAPGVARPNMRFEAPVEPADLPAALGRGTVHVVLQATGSSHYAMPSKVVNALCCGATVVAVADAASPLAKLATEVDGLAVIVDRDVRTLARVVADSLDGAADAERRRAIAAAAADRFSRNSVLERLEALLLT